MKLYTSVLIILLLMIAIPDIFFYLKLKRKDQKEIYVIFHLIPALLFTGMFLYIKFGLELSHNFRVVAEILWLYFFFLVIYISKILHVIFYFLNYLFRLIFHHDDIYFNYARFILTGLVIGYMAVSAYITPRNYDVTNVQVEIPKLPASFDGYKIVLISDAHLGSWNKKFGKIKKVVKLVNEQNPDIILFAGDMVNNFASEAEGWQPYFRELNSKSGNYAILGNHDYGDYADWKSQKDRMDNRLKIKQAIRNFGFRLLLNEHVYLKKGSDSILLAGVEDWNKNKAANYCDINKALAGSSSETPKILLSHDPTEFDLEIAGKKDIALTLSGHTHAGQMGFRIGDKLYSPSSFIFKYYAGLYKVNEQFIYVNRGIGFIGLPMFIGVRPEITVITLKVPVK